MRCFAISAAAVLMFPALVLADEPPVKSRIESVAMFKNGLAVIRRSVPVNGPGVYRVEDVPTPVHGTFFIESRDAVAVGLGYREVEVPPRAGENVDFQGELAGRKVTMHFKEQGVPPVSGTVVELPKAKGDRAWNRDYANRPDWYYSYGRYGMPAPAASRFILLETEKGSTYVDSAMIASLAVDGAAKVVRRRMPVLTLTVADGKKEAGTVTISYLAKGISWAPSYRVNLDDSKRLSIEQQAAIKNEMEDLKDTELMLISGYPSVQFAHVTSPLSLDTGWSNFFQQLNQRIGRGSDLSSNVRQQAVAYNIPGDTGIDLSATPSGEGVDLHYQSIGKRTMGEGDSLGLAVAKASAEYEKIVEWIVPDTRNPDGQHIGDYERNQDPDKFHAAWDAVRFRNPLPFPMTTAPAAVWSGGKFNGQRQSYWVNINELTTLHITKALSIRTRATEQEDQGSGREVINIGGRNFRKVNVKGELAINNHRKEDIKLVIRRQFSGELIKADLEPKVTWREEGVYSINKRNELYWTFPLKSGEEKTLAYSYSVLVYH